MCGIAWQFCKIKSCVLHSKKPKIFGRLIHIPRNMLTNMETAHNKILGRKKRKKKHEKRILLMLTVTRKSSAILYTDDNDCINSDLCALTLFFSFFHSFFYYEKRDLIFSFLLFFSSFSLTFVVIYKHFISILRCCLWYGHWKQFVSGIKYISIF